MEEIINTLSNAIICRNDNINDISKLMDTIILSNRYQRIKHDRSKVRDWKDYNLRNYMKEYNILKIEAKYNINVIRESQKIGLIECPFCDSEVYKNGK